MDSKLFKSCRLCGHACGVDRLNDRKGVCGAGALPVVSAYCLHRGEEPMISGRRGSGTIFFANCCLDCIFCQNYEISQKGKGKEADAGELAEVMLELQRMGAHNINLVSPTHYAPPISQAIASAKERGLAVPIVYNTGGYDSLETLKGMEGLVDIYLPDLKYFDEQKAERYSGANNYVAVARAGLAEMFRQVGDIVTDKDGIAMRGLLVRHLVLPNDQADSRRALEFLASLSRDLWVSLMAQYNPLQRAAESPELSRKLAAEEYEAVIAYAEAMGLSNLYLQESGSSDNYLPDFNKAHPFE